MKKIVFLLVMLVVATTATKAQDMFTTVRSNNATLLQPAGSYIFYGDQVMDKKDCVEFLATRHQPAYEKFQNGFKCYQAGWWLMGAGLAVDLAGSILVAFTPGENNNKGDNDAMFYSGITCLGLGAAAILASVPTIFVGYARMNQGIDMFNINQAQSTNPQAYWTIQGSQNGIGLALHF